MRERNRKNDYKDAVDYLESSNSTIADAAKEFNLSRPNLTNFYNGALYGFEKAAATDEKIAKSLGTREANLFKNQYKNNLKAREVNSNLRKDAFFELFVDEYVIPNIKPINIKKYTPFYKIDETRDLQRFYIGDMHYNGSKESIQDIKRIASLILEEYNGAKEIDIVLGGDEIENTHHTNQQINKRVNVMDQVLGVSKLMAEAIAEVKSNLPNVIINLYFLSGNHSEIRQMGVKAREDNESVTPIIRELMKSYLIDNDIVFIEQSNYDELFLDGVYITHGDIIKGDFMSFLTTRSQQQKENFKGINKFVSFHTHRYYYEIKKGTDIHFIKAPCVKTWVGDWEKDSNQLGTPGILVEHKGSFKYVPIVKEKE